LQLTMLDFELSTNHGLSFEAQSTGASFLPPSMTRKRSRGHPGRKGCGHLCPRRLQPLGRFAAATESTAW
jgi:hypothetical protein